MEIFLGKEALLNIPDLQTAYLIEHLRRSRGGQSSFEISDSLMIRLNALMKQPQYFSNDFSGFSGLSTLLSSDKYVKVVTWNVENTSGEHFFYGLTAIQQDNKVEVYRLKDSTREIENPELSTLNTSKWYGAIYYDMVMVSHRNQNYYTIIGYNGKDAFSHIKLIDVITINTNGKPQFGAPIFDIKGRTKQRLIFEHSKQANMMLRYNERTEMIVMDHLSPIDPAYQDDRGNYGPDFSHDALEFQKGKWVLLENIELRNR
jgi:hypothetical protein